MMMKFDYFSLCETYRIPKEVCRMKTKSALLISMICLMQSVAIAKSQDCKSISKDRWWNATVQSVTPAGQHVDHVIAFGAYLVADLFCYFGSCVGFVNGNKAVGSLKLDPHDSSQILAIEIHESAAVPGGAFRCD